MPWRRLDRQLAPDKGDPLLHSQQAAACFMSGPCQNLSDILSDLGHHVDYAQNGPAALKLVLAFLYVVHDAVASHEIESILLADVLRSFANDNSQLNFPIGLLRASWNLQIVVRSRDRAGSLHEHYRFLGNLCARFRRMFRISGFRNREQLTLTDEETQRDLARRGLVRVCDLREQFAAFQKQFL